MIAIVESDATSHGSTSSEEKLASVVRPLLLAVANLNPSGAYASGPCCLELIRDDIGANMGVTFSLCFSDVWGESLRRFREVSILISM